MDARDARGEGLGLLSRVVGTAVSMSVIAGYVALSATVLAGRALFGVATGMWRRMWSLRVSPRGKEAETPRAA